MVTYYNMNLCVAVIAQPQHIIIVFLVIAQVMVTMHRDIRRPAGFAVGGLSNFSILNRYRQHHIGTMLLYALRALLFPITLLCGAATLALTVSFATKLLTFVLNTRPHIQALTLPYFKSPTIFRSVFFSLLFNMRQLPMLSQPNRKAGFTPTFATVSISLLGRESTQRLLNPTLNAAFHVSQDNRTSS
jgi:hypothetical protein